MVPLLVMVVPTMHVTPFLGVVLRKPTAVPILATYVSTILVLLIQIAVFLLRNVVLVQLVQIIPVWLAVVPLVVRSIVIAVAVVNV